MIHFSRRAGMIAIAVGVGALGWPLVSQTSASFTAAITNSDNWARSASIVMEEKQFPDSSRTTASQTCLSSNGTGNAFTCTTINKYGGQTLVPGGSVTTYLTIRNTGDTAATAFTLTGAACTKTGVGAYVGSGNLCDSLQVAVTDLGNGKTVFNGSATSLVSTVNDVLSALGKASVTTADVINLEVKVTLPAGADNSVMGQKAAQQLTWTFTV